MCHKSEIKDRKDQDQKELGEAGTSFTDAERSMLSEDMRREQLVRNLPLKHRNSLLLNILITGYFYSDILYALEA